MNSSNPKTSALLCHPSDVPDLQRRGLLRHGASLAAYLSLPKMLGLGFAHAAESYPPQRRLVWINLRGGWDLLESVDPKPASTSGIDMVYSYAESHGLSGTTDPDARVGRWLPGLAAQGGDVLLLRGLAMGTTSHDAGSIYMETGILSNAGRVNAASIPAIVASESQATIPVIQLSGGGELMQDRGLLKPVSPVRAENLELYRALYPTEEAAVAQRIKILDYLKNSLTRVKQQTGSNDRLTSVEAAESKIRVQLESGVGSRLDLTTADKAPFSAALQASGNRGGGGMLDSFSLALKLLKQDLVTCVNLGVGGFDTHANQDRALQPILSNFDLYLKVFVDQLRAAGQLDNTLIVLYSDFGRTPKVNGSNGRDHWPVGGAVMIGGGIAGGRVVGGTDDNFRAQNINLTSGAVDSAGSQLSPANLAAAVIELTLGTSYLEKRPYLVPVPALTRLRT